jgi:excisionase family DNA binding protein
MPDKLQSLIDKTEDRFDKLAWQVNPLCKQLGISRSTFYNLVRSGGIKVVRIGGRTLCPASEVGRLLKVT